MRMLVGMDIKENPVLPKVWITKYALTQGVFTLTNVERCDSINPDMITGKGMGCYHKNEWHTNEADALARAEMMRRNKIAALRKQAAKLEKLEFRVSDGGDASEE